MKLIGIKYWLPLLWLIFFSSATAGQFDVVQTREEVLQKLQLVKMLIASSPVAKNSEDKNAKQTMELVHSLYTRANDAFIAGNLVWADAFSDEALSVMEDAARISSDPLQVEAKQRSRYAELLDDVRAFEATYKDVRKGLSSNEVASYDDKINRTDKLIKDAQALIRDGQYADASKQLERVHTIYISVLNELLASTSFVYDKTFNTPVEEYDYELARYRSYEELIPIAYDQFKPDEYTIKLSDRFVQEGSTALGIAEKQAANGDHPTAIKTLLGATKRLQTALRTVGLEVPE